MRRAPDTLDARSLQKARSLNDDVDRRHNRRGGDQDELNFIDWDRVELEPLSHPLRGPPAWMGSEASSAPAESTYVRGSRSPPSTSVAALCFSQLARCRVFSRA
jgi:hypothetical protein